MTRRISPLTETRAPGYNCFESGLFMKWDSDFWMETVSMKEYTFAYGSGSVRIPLDERQVSAVVSGNDIPPRSFMSDRIAAIGWGYRFGW